MYSHIRCASPLLMLPRNAGGMPSDHPCAQLLPLNVMCAVFSAQLAVGDLDEMYVQQRPIPTAELHSGAQPSTGPGLI